MTRFHRPAARPQPEQIPKFWRPKLEESRQITCQIIHWDLVTSFTTGSATIKELWDWIETGFTYLEMMRLLILDGVDFPEADQLAMNAQIESYDGVIARYHQTQRVGFNGSELAIARAAARVMDDLIKKDRHGIADRAALFSMTQMRSLWATGKCVLITKTKKRRKS